MRSKLLLIIVVLGVLGGALPAMAGLAGGTFVDDNGSVHESNIEALAAEGITAGCNPPFGDKFCPNSQLTRGQMAAFLHRSLPDGGSSPSAGFVDTVGTTFEGDIDWMADKAITLGCNPPTNNQFCPDSPVTRGQMAAFLVRAMGYTDAGSGDLFSDDDSSIFEGDIDKLGTAGVTLGCNPPENDHFCPGQAVTRAQMATFLVRALGLTPITVEPVGSLVSELIGGSFDQPVYLTAPDGDTRLFVVEKLGRIIVVEDGQQLGTPFLDISSLVPYGGERGLLSMVFHPDYEMNGLFYVYYSGAAHAGGNHSSYIVEYSVSGDPNIADSASARTVMRVSQPASNHNGGQLLFGPDGYLFIALGDGGDGGAHGQDTDTLLGSILRIDVSGMPYSIPADNPFVGTDGEDEIFLYGVRNPWRIWIDGEDLYVADVGQGSREEVTVLNLEEANGANLGWRTKEGTRCYSPSSGCDSTGLTDPQIEYTHAEGCSITGGVVYRGPVAELQGWYLYNDVCGDWLRAARFWNGDLIEEQDLTSELGPIGALWSFGVDGVGNVYMLRGSAGTVRLITTS